MKLLEKNLGGEQIKKKRKDDLIIKKKKFQNLYYLWINFREQFNQRRESANVKFKLNI